VVRWWGDRLVVLAHTSELPLYGMHRRRRHPRRSLACFANRSLTIRLLLFRVCWFYAKRVQGSVMVELSLPSSALTHSRAPETLQVMCCTMNQANGTRVSKTGRPYDGPLVDLRCIVALVWEFPETLQVMCCTMNRTNSTRVSKTGSPYGRPLVDLRCIFALV